MPLFMRGQKPRLTTQSQRTGTDVRATTQDRRSQRKAESQDQRQTIFPILTPMETQTTTTAYIVHDKTCREWKRFTDEARARKEYAAIRTYYENVPGVTVPSPSAELYEETTVKTTRLIS